MVAPRVRLALLGTTNVGKTQILRRYVSGDFSEERNTTIGLDFANIDVEQRDGRVIKTQLWDTAGDERYQPMSPDHLFSTCHGFVLVFDLSCLSSFAHIQTRLDTSTGQKPAPTLLLGNKLDKPREVSFEVACQFARTHSLLYEEVSAKTCYNLLPALTRFIHGFF